MIGFKFLWSGGYELMDKVVTSEKVLVGGDFNGHAGSDMGGFREARGDFGIGQIHDGGVRLLDWAVSKWLWLLNTCFQKRKSWLITFRSSETETMIDQYRSSVKDVNVFPGEEIMNQHCILLMDMVFKKKARRKVKFRKKLKLRRLRESEVKEEFAKGVINKCDGNKDQCGLKRELLNSPKFSPHHTVRSFICLKLQIFKKITGKENR